MHVHSSLLITINGRFFLVYFVVARIERAYIVGFDQFVWFTYVPSLDRISGYWLAADKLLIYSNGILIDVSYLSRPTTNAIMGLTVANYVLQPFFSADCGVPPLAAQLIAAILICK